MAKLAHALAKNLYKLRSDRSLTQEELAKQLGVSRASINRYESGGFGTTIATLTKLAVVLGVEETDLVKDPALSEKIELSQKDLQSFKNLLKASEAPRTLEPPNAHTPSALIPTDLLESLAKLSPSQRTELFEKWRKELRAYP